MIFPFIISSQISSQISSNGGRRKDKNSSAARGTYLWMNPLKTPLAKTTIREMTEMEHLTRMNSTTIITDTLQMLYLMKGALNETNSSHAARKH